MTQPTKWQVEKRSFRRHPVRFLIIWTILISWCAAFFWIKHAGVQSVASTLFSTSTPSLMHKVVACLLMIYPVVLFMLYILVRLPSKMREQRLRPHAKQGQSDVRFR